MRVMIPLTVALALTASMIAAPLRPGHADSNFDETRLSTTTVGKPVVVGHHSNTNNKCQITRTPNITVTTPPAHGEISTRPGAYTVNKVGSHCNGREVEGVLVVYTPAAGFTGDDKFIYNVSYGTSVQTNTVAVSVH